MSIYEQFGIEPIINCSGTVTRLGGALMSEEVLDSFVAAARDAVPIDHIQAAASRLISKTTGAEAGLVTAGSAAAMTLGAAAILAGFDLGRIEQLPHADSFPNQFIVSRDHRNGYDHAVRAAGVRFCEIGLNEIVSGAGVRRTEAWEYEAAIDEQTAGIFYVLSDTSRPELEDVVRVAHEHELPLLVDAAAELPPRENLKRIIGTGADLVAFSGGKAIRGPQSTGILCGRRDLVSSATLQMLDMDEHFDLWDPSPDWIDKFQLAGIPRHGIGRALKVSKEEIVALLVALETFASGKLDLQVNDLRDRLQQIVSGVEGLPVTCVIRESPDGQRYPILTIAVHQDAKLTAFEACQQLRRGSPPVYPGHGRLDHGELVVNPLCIKNDQIIPLIRRLRDVLG